MEELPIDLQIDIIQYDKANLRKVPSIGRRKIPYDYVTLPTTQILEDIICFVHEWSKTEYHLLGKVNINNLKKKLAVLEQELFLQSRGIY